MASLASAIGDSDLDEDSRCRGAPDVAGGQRGGRLRSGREAAPGASPRGEPQSWRRRPTLKTSSCSKRSMRLSALTLRIGDRFPCLPHRMDRVAQLPGPARLFRRGAPSCSLKRCVAGGAHDGINVPRRRPQSRPKSGARVLRSRTRNRRAIPGLA